MDHQPPQTLANLADVIHGPFNLHHSGRFEIMVRVRRGALRLGAAWCWSPGGAPQRVFIVGCRITNMYPRNEWPSEQGNTVKIMLDGVPHAQVAMGQYIGQDEPSSPVIIPSRDEAIRGEAGRQQAEEVAAWLQSVFGASAAVHVVRVGDQRTDDPDRAEWGLAFTSPKMSTWLRLTLKEVSLFD